MTDEAGQDTLPAGLDITTGKENAMSTGVKGFAARCVLSAAIATTSMAGVAHAGYFTGGGYSALLFVNQQYECDEAHYGIDYNIHGIITQLWDAFKLAPKYSTSYIDWGSNDGAGNSKYVYGTYYVENTIVYPSCTQNP